MPYVKLYDDEPPIILQSAAHENTHEYKTWEVPINSPIGKTNLVLGAAMGSDQPHHKDIPLGLFTIYVLFNPYHKDDDVYMEEKSDREEYIEREAGFLFNVPDWYNIHPSVFSYSNFSGVCLETVMKEIMDPNNTNKNYGIYGSIDKKSPVSVSRFLSWLGSQFIEGNWEAQMGADMGLWKKYYFIHRKKKYGAGGINLKTLKKDTKINYSVFVDPDNYPVTLTPKEVETILEGRVSPNGYYGHLLIDEKGNPHYTLNNTKPSEGLGPGEAWANNNGGNWTRSGQTLRAPSDWNDVENIIEEYNKTGQAQFAQCWVFGAVLNMSLRTVGIPSREITNYDSAHPECGNSPWDNTCNENKNVNFGTIIRKKKIKKNGKDKTVDVDGWTFIWNYHCWNDAWMKRPDLKKEGQYDGWQAVDATVQNASDGLYRLGPAPLKAVKDLTDKVDDKMAAPWYLEWDKEEGTGPKYGKIDYDVGMIQSEVNYREWYMNGDENDINKWKPQYDPPLIGVKGVNGKFAFITGWIGGVPLTTKKGVKLLPTLRGKDTYTILYDYKPESYGGTIDLLKEIENYKYRLSDLSPIKKQDVLLKIESKGVADNVIIDVNLLSDSSGKVKLEITHMVVTYTNSIISSSIIENNTKFVKGKNYMNYTYNLGQLDVSMSNYHKFKVLTIFPDGKFSTSERTIYINSPLFIVDAPHSISENEIIPVNFIYTNPYSNKKLTNVIITVSAKFFGYKEVIKYDSIDSLEKINISRKININVPSHHQIDNALIMANLKCDEIEEPSKGFMNVEL